MDWSGHISLWPYEQIENRRQVIVAQKSDIDEVTFFIENGEIPAPGALFYLVPSARAYSEVLLYWLKYERFADLKVDIAPNEITRFFDLWERFCQAPYISRSEIVEQISKAPPKSVAQAIPSLQYIGDFLAQALDATLRPLICAAGAYYDYQPTTGIRDWWRHEPTFLRELASQIERLQSFKNQSHAFAFGLEHSEALAKLIAGLNNHKIESALDNAALLCLISGELAHRQGQNTSAVILFHRALDFFLQGRCMEHGLLTETGRGLEFSHSRNDVSVGAANCYRELNDNQKYVFKRKVKQTVRACNDIRNNLLFTHSIYGASEAYAARYKTAIGECIREIDSSAGRKLLTGCERFFNRILIEPRLLFCLERDLRNSIVNVSFQNISF